MVFALKVIIIIVLFGVSFFQEAPQYRLGGTIRDIPGLNATSDAIKLKRAMRGWGTDEKAVADIMTTRSINDRIKIANAYKQMYGKDLGYKFTWEFSFHAKEMLEDMLISPIDYDAQILYSSMKGIGTDLDSITSVLCSKDNSQMQGVKNSYQRRYNKPLEKALHGDVSDPLFNLYKMLINTPREERSNPQLVEQDVREIMATDLKHFRNDNALFKILATRSKDHIRQVVALYQRMTNTPLTSVLEQDLSGPITIQGKTVRTVKNLVQCFVDPPKFYAQQIDNYMKGAGTSDKKLFRQLIARSEIDLEDIKSEYQKMFGQSLVNRIQKEGTGTYQKMLTGILNGNRQLFQAFPSNRRPSTNPHHYP